MVNKNVFLGVGHGGADSGAVGYVREETINLKMALACRDYLESEYVGVTVKMSRTKDENDPLTEEIRECNKFITKKSEGVAVDIHNNAGGGDGFEAYYSVSGGTGKTLAKNIEKEIKKVGQNSRGCKTRANKSGSDYYGFIRQTIAPAVITECVFVDNKKDAAQADTDKECKEFGEAIAKGIAATLGLEKKKNTFDATMAKYCVPDGPFVVLPVAGPSTPRHLTGWVADSYTSPLYWSLANSDNEKSNAVVWGATGLKYLNLRAENMELLDSVEEGSVDYYEATKSAFLQNRKKFVSLCSQADNNGDNVPNYDFDFEADF